MVIIIRFGENNVLCPKYINLYEFRGYGWTCMVHHIFCLLFKITEKVPEHDQYLNRILHHFDLILFLIG